MQRGRRVQRRDLEGGGHFFRTVLRHFDPDLLTLLETDASKFGVGALSSRRNMVNIIVLFAFWLVGSDDSRIPPLLNPSHP